VLTACSASTALAAISVQSHLDEHTGYSGLWGYSMTEPVPREFALVGTSTGTAIVETTIPTAATEVAFVAGAASNERVCRTYVNVAYIAAATDGGLQIVSLTDPTAPVLVATSPAISRARALSVDPLLKRLYATGTENGVTVLDIENPAAPVVLATYDEQSLEDAFYDTGLLYGGAGYGLAILDMSGLPAISLKAWVTYAGNAPSGLWLSEDRRFVYSIDRKPGGRLAAITLTPILSATRVGTYEIPSDEAAQPESIVLEGETAYVPWGSAGLVLVDVSDPRNPQEIDRFTPSPRERDGAGSGSGLGAVRVYPFAAAEILYLTDTEAGLYVLDAAPEVGIIEGTLTSSADKLPAQSTLVRVPDAGKSITTENDGTYHLRLPAGDHRVFFTRPDRFFPDSLDVTILAGETLVVDRALDPLPYGTLRGGVTRLPSPDRARTGQAAHPEGTIISFLNAPFSPIVVFDQTYFRPFLPAGTYLIEANEFGYNPVQVEVTVNAGVTTIHDFTISGVEYSDKFESESGWVVGAPDDDATAGIWERGDPIGTGAGFVQPTNDESPSPGILAFVTGNGAVGDWIDANDVDGGTTTLTSPMYDLSAIDAPIVRYYRWFCNNASWTSEAPDGDSFRFEGSSDGGASWVPISSETRTQLFWREQTYVVGDYLTPSAQTRFRFRVSDEGIPSIVEAGVDDFVIYSGGDLVQLPVTPIAFDAVSVHSPRPGVVHVRWTAEGGYEAFAIERGARGGTEIVGWVVGHAGRTDYAFTDTGAPPGAAAVYWIVGHADDGATERVGPLPVRVLDGEGFLPVLSVAPNPTSGMTRVDLQVPAGGSSRVRLELFDVAGRRVRLLFDGMAPSGPLSLPWDGRDEAGRPVTAGVYVYRLEAGDRDVEQKLIVLR
jgi:hypothetical protein